jgi:5-methylthioadenosine/S-adenosylhomocysteine deaminase
MHSRGVTVGLGTDSVVTNDSMDLFQVMKICALIHKVNMGSTYAMTAEKVLEMGTIDAAKALTMDDTVGSLSPGKKADIILLNMDHPGLLPSIFPVKNIVYGAGGGCSVDTVIVNGEFLMKDRELLTLDEREVYSTAEEVGRSILSRGGRLGEGERHIHFGPWRYE